VKKLKFVESFLTKTETTHLLSRSNYNCNCFKKVEHPIDTFTIRKIKFNIIEPSFERFCCF